jgi:excinuclease ABC subunit B
MKKPLFTLKSHFQPTGDQPKAIKQLLESRPNNATLLGVTGSGKTFTIANVIAAQNKQVIIMSPNKTLAAQLYEEFSHFFPYNKVCYFVSFYDYYRPESYLPASDMYIEKETRINQEIDRMRLESVAAAINRKDTIIICSVSCIYALGNPEDFKTLSISLFLNQVISQKKVMEILLKIEYSRNDIEKTKHGTFQVYPQAIEIVLPYQKEIVRIEFTDEKIVYIGLFSKESRMEVEQLDNILIMPAKYFVTTDLKKKQALKSINEEFNNWMPQLPKTLYQERLENRVLRDLELITQTGSCQGIENYSPHFEGRLSGEKPYTIFDFCTDPLIIIDESHLSIPQLKAMYVGDQARKSNLVEYGFRLPSAKHNRPLMFSEIEEKLKNTIFVSATPSEYELSHSSVIAEQIIRPTGIVDPHIEIHGRENQLIYLKSEIDRYIDLGFRSLVTVMTKKMAEDVAQFFEKQHMKVCYLHHMIKIHQRTEILHKLRTGEIDCLIGINLLREGLDLPEVGLVAIMDADIESFLRDKRSLIQTIGRAARNTESKVILFADKISDSMQKAIFETDRRRAIQEEYNKKHNINPISTTRDIDKSILKSKKAQEQMKENKEKTYNEFSFSELKKEIKKLEKKMHALLEKNELEKAKEIKKEWDILKIIEEKKNKKN